jgi:hypothetical protein
MQEIMQVKNTDKIKEPEIEISTLFSIQSEFIDEFYNIFKFISESVINRYYERIKGIYIQ